MCQPGFVARLVCVSDAGVCRPEFSPEGVPLLGVTRRMVLLLQLQLQLLPTLAPHNRIADRIWYYKVIQRITKQIDYNGTKFLTPAASGVLALV